MTFVHLCVAGGDRDGVNVTLLEPLVRKAELSRSEIQILIDLLLNKQQSSAAGNSEWIEVSSVFFFIVPICKKGDKTDFSNCTGISLLPTTYGILSNILLSRLTVCAEEITGDHQCGI